MYLSVVHHATEVLSTLNKMLMRGSRPVSGPLGGGFTLVIPSLHYRL